MNMNLINEVTASQLRNDLPKLSIGDTVIVGVTIKEGNKTRVQEYQGLVIKMKGTGISQSFVVRKISNGVGVERVFPLHSPIIAYVKVLSHGLVRRAKLYYLRNLKGKAASKVKEKL